MRAVAIITLGMAATAAALSLGTTAAEAGALSGAASVHDGDTFDIAPDTIRLAGAAAPDPACPIKGNIGTTGECIYHMLWSPWYDRTRISVAAGERWFCDEAEAVAAGWRAARE